MRGRKPKATVIKLFTGNPGKRPLNAQEPRPPLELPAPPPELNDDAKVEWGRVAEVLYNIGVLTRVDRAVFAAYCQAYGRWMQAERALAVTAKLRPEFSGLLVLTSNKHLVQNPLVGIANKAHADMVRYAAELGMTPSARSRIKAEPHDDDGETAQKYFD